MEGLTFAEARRKPHASRLVKVSVRFALADGIRYARPVAQLSTLGDIPATVRHSERIGRMESLPPEDNTGLQRTICFALTGIGSLWVGHLSEPGRKPGCMWEYLEVRSMLAKEMKFKIFLSHA
ncbi:MAG: hypothetical protein ACLR6J_13080 [Parabacteroides merdae]